MPSKMDNQSNAYAQELEDIEKLAATILAKAADFEQKTANLQAGIAEFEAELFLHDDYLAQAAVIFGPFGKEASKEEAKAAPKDGLLEDMASMCKEWESGLGKIVQSKTRHKHIRNIILDLGPALRKISAVYRHMLTAKSTKTLLKCPISCDEFDSYLGKILAITPMIRALLRELAHELPFVALVLDQIFIPMPERSFRRSPPIVSVRYTSEQLRSMVLKAISDSEAQAFSPST